MKTKEFIHVKFRLKEELHKNLNAKAELEQRSMNYSINKAVELMVNPTKETKV